ncbi:MAG: hypothetical protein ACRDRN_00075 [Sciscionella sp.]
MRKRTVVGIIAVATSCAVISLFGAGMANASETMQQAQAATHSISQPTIAAQAQHLQALHDQLQAAMKAGKVAGARSAVDSLHGALGTLRASGPRAIGNKSAGLVDKAQRQDTEAAKKLAALSSTPNGLTPAGDPLGTLSALLQTLLASLQALIGSLLGSVPAPPVPVPVPPVPVPAPPVPVPVPPVPAHS